MNVNQTIRKIFSRAAMMLLAVMTLAMTVQSVWAWDGSGTKDDPWQIKTPADLQKIGTGGYSGRYFRVMNDITFEHTTAWNDASSQENNFTPIGFSGYYAHHFKGHFDGNGKTISGIRIYKSGTTDGVDYFLGLFCKLDYHADVKGIVLADTRITGYKYVGGIAGITSEYATITDCVVESTVCINGVQDGNNNHGGVVGQVPEGTVIGCRSAATLTNSASTCYYYGSIYGYRYDYGPTIKHCFSNNASQDYSITGPSNIDIVGYGTPVNYTVSGITGYEGNCYEYDGTLYASANQNLKLIINFTGSLSTGIGVGYTDGNGNNLTKNDDGSFNLTMPASNVTINPAWLIALTITADSGTKVYDGTPLTKNSFTNDNYLSSGDVITDITFTGSQTDVGSSDNIPSGAVIKNGNNDVTSNYSITYKKGTLTVNRKAVTITAGDGTKTYDGAALTQNSVTTTALETGDTHTFTVAMTPGSTITNAGSASNVIATVDGVAVTTGTATEVGNYLVTTADGTLTVNRKAVTITAAGGTKTYDGAALTQNNVTTTALETGDTHTFTVAMTPGSTITNAGSASNVIATVDGVAVTTGTAKEVGNYLVTTADGTLTVNPKAVTITTGSGSKGYDGAALTKAEAGIVGLENGETATITTTGSQTEVGSSSNSYQIEWGTASSSNYTITESLGTLEVTKNDNEITLTAASDNKTYDGTALANSSVTATGLPAGLTVVATASGSQINTGSSANVVNDGYVIKNASGEDKTANFTKVTKVNGTLEVTAKTVSSPTIILGETTYIYDGNAKEPTVTVKDGETVIPATEYTVSYLDNTNAGSANVTITDNEGGNYVVSGSATFEITTADGAVTAPTAVSSLVYSGAAQALISAGSSSTGTIWYSLDGKTYGTDIPQGTDAKEYTVYYKVIGDKNHSDVAAASLKVAIARKAVTVTADNKTKEAGAADPTLTATVTGLVGSDQVTYTLSRAKGEDAGEYVITATGEATQGNYAVTFVAGKLTITATEDPTPDDPTPDDPTPDDPTPDDPTPDDPIPDDPTPDDPTPVDPVPDDPTPDDPTPVDPVSDDPVPAEETIKISTALQVPYCSEYNLDFTDKPELKAYVATGYDKSTGVIWLTRVKQVPAETGFLLMGDPGDYDIPTIEGVSDVYYKNMFKGTLEGTTLYTTDGDYTNYYLSKGDAGVGFYKVTKEEGVKVGANRCYLPILTEIPANGSTGDTELIKVSAAKQVPYFTSKNLDFSSLDAQGVKAYTATGYNYSTGVIWLTRVKKVPAKTGILVMADGEGEYNVPTTTVQSVYENMFVGSETAQTIYTNEEIDGVDYVNYYLSKGDAGVGFYKVTNEDGVKMGANRCYLPIPKRDSASGARGKNAEDTFCNMVISDNDDDVIAIPLFTDGTTGIDIQSSIFNDQSNEVYYNLQGQRVDKPTKGVFIKNGKKVVIK